MLTAVHPGDSTHVLVTFTASSESAAKAGLVAASKSALRSLAEGRLQRAGIELQAANQLRGSALAALSDPRRREEALPGISPEAWLASLQTIANQSSQALFDAQQQSATAQMALQSIDETVTTTPVSVEQLSSQSDEIRMILTATLSSFALAVILTFGHLRWSSSSANSDKRKRSWLQSANTRITRDEAATITRSSVEPGTNTKPDSRLSG